MDFEALRPETVTSTSVAAKIGDVKALKCLLKKGKATNIQDNRGWRALHHASYGGNLECVELLLKAPDVDVNAISFERQTALSLVCSSRNKSTVVYSIAEALLKAGADPNVEIINQFQNIFNIAVKRNYIPLVKLLIDYKVKVNQPDDKYGYALNIVAENGSREMLQLLLQQKLIIDPKQPQSAWFFIPLISDFGEKDDMLKMILKKPEYLAHINIQDFSKRTPLMIACNYGCEEAIKLLLNLGADPNIRDNSGFLPLCVAAHRLPDEAVCGDDRAFVQLFRLTCKRDVNYAGSHPLSSLLFAVLLRGQKKEMLKFVLREGKLKTNVILLAPALRDYVDPLLSTLYYKTSDSFSPLALLYGSKDTDTSDSARLLLKDMPINNMSNGRIPPLIEVAVCSNGFDSFTERRFDIIYYLLSKGANVMLKVRRNDPIPTIFLVCILQPTAVCLEFLLLHSLPAELIFTNKAFDFLIDYFKRADDGYDDWTNIFKWLLVLNKYLPQFPPAIHNLLFKYREVMTYCENFRYGIRKSDIEECSKEEKDFRELIENPKTLEHLAALRVRRVLGENRKNVLLSTSVLQLCQKLQLSTVIKRALMFNFDKECHRTVS